VAKVKNQNIPAYADWFTSGLAPDPYPAKYRNTLKEGSPKKGLSPQWTIVTKTTRGRRPATRTKRRDGLWYDPTFTDLPFDPNKIPDDQLINKFGNRTTSRAVFKKAISQWHALTPAARQCWVDKARASGKKCSYFDFFMRSQLHNWYKTGAWDTQTCVLCSQPNIIYTTHNMPISSSQTIRVEDPSWGPFTWSVMFGSGTITNNGDGSATYTAPASNPKCRQNPVIRVVDICGRFSIWSVGVSSYAPGQRAYRVTNQHVWGNAPWGTNHGGVTCLFPYCCACWDVYYDCYGDFVSWGYHSWAWSDQPMGTYNDWLASCRPEESQLLDCRSIPMLNGECCPQALI